MSLNQLLLGDNLEILRSLDSESVDLVYLDLPLFSNRTYEFIWGDKGEVRSFEDRFSGGTDHYVAWLKGRVQDTASFPSSPTIITKNGNMVQ